MSILLTHMLDSTVVQQHIESDKLLLDSLIQKEFLGTKLNEVETLLLENGLPENFGVEV